MTGSIRTVDRIELDDRERRWRRGFIWIAVGIMVLGGLHFVDHVIRGVVVVERGLDPTWNHSGWPFRDEVTPFTFSLVGVYLILGLGIALTVARRAWAGFWLAAAVVLLGVVVFVHFLSAVAETPAVILNTYGDPVPGIAALADLFLLGATLLMLAGYAVRVRLASGRW